MTSLGARVLSLFGNPRMLRETFTSLFQKPATLAYPAGKVVDIPKYRGKLEFDPVKCSGCNMCVKDCPASAISITKLADKKFECTIELDHCIYCAQCVDSCVKKALQPTPEFELASIETVSLKFVVSAKVTDTEVAAYKDAEAVKAAKAAARKAAEAAAAEAPTEAAKPE
jgi:formate hydrogenlyase subunit 6/NADH:ubiquinone oxidoreductase subunit I